MEKLFRTDLSTEESQRNEGLLRRIAEGDEQALARLVEQNAGLVKSTAKHFVGRGTEYEDLVQIGSIGMMKAARSFDFRYETTFSTYAVPLIAGEIRRFLRDDGSIKVGRGLRQTAYLAMRETEQFVRENGRQPRLNELAERMQIPVEELTEAMDAAAPVKSLQEPIGGEEGGEGITFGELLPGGEEPELLLDRIALREAVRSLSPLWRQIVYCRFFRDLSQQQTGKVLGLSQVKVSREEKKILARLREKMA